MRPASFAACLRTRSSWSLAKAFLQRVVQLFEALDADRPRKLKLARFGHLLLHLPISAP